MVHWHFTHVLLQNIQVFIILNNKEDLCWSQWVGNLDCPTHCRVTKLSGKNIWKSVEPFWGPCLETLRMVHYLTCHRNFPTMQPLPKLGLPWTRQENYLHTQQVRKTPKSSWHMPRQTSRQPRVTDFMLGACRSCRLKNRSRTCGVPRVLDPSRTGWNVFSLSRAERLEAPVQKQKT